MRIGRTACQPSRVNIGSRLAWTVASKRSTPAFSASAQAALTKAVAEEKDWLKKQIEEGDKLRRMEIPAEESPQRQAWINRADVFLKRKDLTKEVPNVPNMKLRELYEFPTVSRLREDYETVRSRVDKIRGGLSNS